MFTQWICIIILQFRWESHDLTLIVSFIKFHHLVSIVLNNHLLRDCYMQAIRDSYKTQCSLSAQTEIWCEISLWSFLASLTQLCFILYIDLSQANIPCYLVMSTQNTEAPALSPRPAFHTGLCGQLPCTHSCHCLARFCDFSHFSALALIFSGLMFKNISSTLR